MSKIRCFCFNFGVFSSFAVKKVIVSCTHVCLNNGDKHQKTTLNLNFR